MSLHNPIQPLRAMYIQKVLPAVYDDSLSYYELLAKIQEKCNELVDSNNAQNVAIATINQIVEDFTAGGYLDSFDEFAQEWIEDNLTTYIEEIIHEISQPVVMEQVAEGYVPFPAYPLNKFGNIGQVLSSVGNGATEWVNPVIVDDDVAEQVIDEWLNDHPEATTTVTDGSVTDAKLYQGINGILNRTTMNTNALRSLGSFVTFYETMPTFEVDGTSIIVTPTDTHIRILCLAWQRVCAVLTGTLQNLNPLTIPHGNVLVYNSTSAEFRVTTNILELSDHDFICLYNSRGNCIGPWKTMFDQYMLTHSIEHYHGIAEDDIDETYAITSEITTFVDFYGNAPTFVKTGNTISVDLPYSGVRILTYKQDNVIKVISNTYIDQDVVEVPHNNYLVYDIANNEFAAVPYGNYSSSDDIVICFYNSAGNMIGPWKSIYAVDLTKSLDTRVTALENNESDTIPDYYETHVVQKESAINTQLMAGSEMISFIFVTDPHWESNRKNSPSLCKHICNRTNIDTIIVNGDFIDGQPSKTEAISLINECASKYDVCDNVYRVVGNHEFNNPSSDPQYESKQLTLTELEWSILASNTSKIDIDEGTCNYTVTDEYRKVMYIVLDCKMDSGVSDDTVAYLASTLESVPSGYDVIVVEHHMVFWSPTYNECRAVSGYGVNMVNIIDAFNNRGTITVYNTPYNYANATGRVLLAVTGHSHRDMSLTTQSGVPVVCTTTDSNRESGGLNRAAGTINEQAFDVVTINRTDKEIKFTRIGAGSDRTFTWS